MRWGAVAAMMRTARGSTELQSAPADDSVLDAQERCMQSAREREVTLLARL